MAITLRTPTVDELTSAIENLGSWQQDGAPMQLHPGDIGWFWRFGAGVTAAAVRTWSRGDALLAVGLLDGRDLLRLTTAPSARRDDELGQQLAADVLDPGRGVLPAGPVNVEAPRDALLHDLLAEAGWGRDEPWTPLCRELAEPVPECGLRVETVGPDHVAERVAVQRAAFPRSTFTEAAWHAMTAGPAYMNGRCLVGYAGGVAVAAVTVWSAGPGRPGLLEPMGVHRDHRGQGHGRAICLAAAGELRESGSSSAIVCTPSGNTGAVATYRAAGFEALPEVRDSVRAG